MFTRGLEKSLINQDNDIEVATIMDRRLFHLTNKLKVSMIPDQNTIKHKSCKSLIR